MLLSLAMTAEHAGKLVSTGTVSIQYSKKRAKEVVGMN